MMKQKVFVVLVALILGAPTRTDASLIDLGSGLIYSTDLNITWYDHRFAGTWPEEMLNARTLSVPSQREQICRGGAKPVTAIRAQP
jgi:hypothetical protein